MNKRAAAEFLGKTERAVERYTEAGKLSVRYKPGKTRPVADYDEGELAKLKHDLDHPSEVRPLVASAAAESPTPTNAVQLRQTAPQALQRAGSSDGLQAFAAMLADALAGLQPRGDGHADAVPLADLSHKMTLSFVEAARLSGVPESHLRAAYAEGKLRGAKIGRGVRMKHPDLEAYVKKL